MRRFFKAALVLATGIAILIFFGVTYIAHKDMVELEFSTYAEAVKAGAMENGTIPSWLPRSATEIHSISGMDTNTEIVEFKFGADFSEYLAKQKYAPAQSAAALGLRRQNKDFSEPKDLIYVPEVTADGESYQGSLLVNREKKRALYFH